MDSWTDMDTRPRDQGVYNTLARNHTLTTDGRRRQLFERSTIASNAKSVDRDRERVKSVSQNETAVFTLSLPRCGFCVVVEVVHCRCLPAGEKYEFIVLASLFR